MDDVRLARMEEKIDSLIEKVDSQREHNDRFYETRDDVRDMQASAKGAWFVLGLFGSITVALSGVVSWFISVWRH